MIYKAQKSKLSRALAIAGLVLASACAWAGAEEDYEAGYKQFMDGDVVTSMNTLRKASNAGHIKAMVLLAEILDRSEFDEEAVGLYRKAAEQGDTQAMYGLATMTASGEGLKKKDLAEARRWMLKAAELGHELATNAIAQSYLQGGFGLTEADRDKPEALEWVKKAAKNDYLPAIIALAQAYGNGSAFGVAADQGLANEYLAQANKIRGIENTKKRRGKKN